jgi:hypothetical protein
LKLNPNSLTQPAKPNRCRLILRRDIVDPRIGRLMAIPVSDMGKASQGDNYGSIADNLRSLYAKIHESRVELAVFAAMPERFRDFPKLATLTPLGYADVPVSDNRACLNFMHDDTSEFQDDLSSLLMRCGAILPNRVRESLPGARCNTAAAWWLLVTMWHAKIKPDACESHRLVDEGSEVPGDHQLSRSVLGIWVWTDPIGASLSAIEALDLTSPQKSEQRDLPGEWTIDPISQSEFARRMSLKKGARPRSIKAMFDRLEKIQVGKNSWIFRLDTLHPATRKKLEGK